ncbi:MAG TPA: M1 family metallopeptidase [Longimicrobiales bacterium]|nr:M1 family metallopeptidase [Longimicrobiales bacterium]
MRLRPVHLALALPAGVALAGALPVGALPARAAAQERPAYTRADTLRGSVGPARAWWDVTFYDLHVRVSPADSSITGWNGITYRVLRPGQELQIDLQPPLEVDSMVLGRTKLEYRRDGNAFFVRLPAPQSPGEVHTVTVHYGGKPAVAVRPPWDGGFIWKQDARGNPWVATANQGLGASVWWPNKDHGSEEPDSQRIAVTVPTPMVNVSNGRLRRTTVNDDGTTTWEWFVASPINNYGIAVNAGSYAHWQEVFDGEDGPLTLDYWPLAENQAAARRQWAQVPPMMRCFEKWFGPYPFYGDGFKLVEAPHLGMEHQGAVAYGNGFANGYRGTDLSGTGQGLAWDFIIVHESAHEWFANSVTAAESGDLWIHESLANYAENLYTECLTGSKEAGAEYVIGTRSRITNDRPIVGDYGVNDQGPGDKYYKGGNMLHTLRQLVEDDERWRGALRGLAREFRHQAVSTAQVEAYLSEATGIPLAEFFEQYLRTNRVPTLEVRREGATLRYRWADVVPGFDMPVRAAVGDGPVTWIYPTRDWKSTVAAVGAELKVDPDFYVGLRVLDGR